MLIVMGGLPCTGKTTLARLPAARIGAVHLRADTIEQAIVQVEVVRSGPAEHRRRVSSRSVDIQGLPSPGRQQVVGREPCESLTTLLARLRSG
ncbi:AAA family ATPase [Streptomyces sp. NPDC049627]|uniref:AAA family ATPase n=1 Tax=Streptomyces sp. NPDC049627 TaxID=3365595 RepID=UPI00378D9C09